LYIPPIEIKTKGQEETGKEEIGKTYDIMAELDKPLPLVQEVFDEINAIEEIQRNNEIIIDFDIMSEDNKSLLEGLSLKIRKVENRDIFGLEIKTKDDEGWVVGNPLLLMDRNNFYSTNEPYELGNITISEPVVIPQINSGHESIKLIKRLIKITATLDPPVLYTG